MDSQKQRYPEWWRRYALKGSIQLQTLRGQTIAKAWQKPRGPAVSEAQAKTQSDFTILAKALKQAWSVDVVAAKAIAGNSQYTYRDVLSRAFVGRLITMVPISPDVFQPMDIQGLLDQISDIPGTIIMRSPTQWVALVNVLELPIITWDAVSGMPVWGELPDSGITELLGDITAGPGTGTQLATLANTTVLPGTYTFATIQVDAKGRLQSASNGSPPSGMNELTGDVLAGPGTGSQASTLSNTSVTPGTYTFATIQVDAKGRLQSASNGSPPSGMNQLTGDVLAGPGTGSQASTLSNTSVTPGTYTFATVQVDAKGRLQSASSGSPPSGMNQLTGDVLAGPGTGSQVSTLSNTAVSAGTYTLATIQVDAKGRITGASNGAAAGIATPYHPGFSTGRYYTTPMDTQATSASVAGNILFAIPFYCPSATTFNRVAINVATSTATSAEIGVYTNVNGKPDALIQDAGTLSLVAPTGRKEITGLTLTLPAGFSWLACGLSGTSTIRITPPNQGLLSNILGTPATLASPGASTAVQGSWTFSAGNLPLTFPTSTDFNTGAPLVYIGL